MERKDFCFGCGWEGKHREHNTCPKCDGKLTLTIKCSCGQWVVCGGFTNTCDCGADFNWSGQQLAARSQWGEETGESAEDIIAAGNSQKCLACDGDGCEQCSGTGWLPANCDW